MKIKCISTLIRISMLTKQASRNGLHSTTRSQIWYIRYNIEVENLDFNWVNKFRQFGLL